MVRERVAALHCPATASAGTVRDTAFSAADLVGEAASLTSPRKLWATKKTGSCRRYSPA